MKNVILMLAVIAMAAPLFGTVNFTGDGSTGSLVLSYTTTDGDLPRGIGLKCEVLGVDTVDVDSDAVVTDPCFNTFIDYAFMNPSTFTIGAGHPMADPCFAGVLDPATSVDVFSICMGVLDQAGNQNAGPATSAPLVSIPLTSTAASVTIRISEDDLRGGVVGSALATNLPIDVTVSFVTDCFYVGMVDSQTHVVTAAEVAQWVTWGKPDCWCYDCFASGDIDGDCFIGTGDLFTMLSGASFVQTACADLDYDGFVGTGDLFTLLVGTSFNTCTVSCTPIP